MNPFCDEDGGVGVALGGGGRGRKLAGVVEKGGDGRDAVGFVEGEFEGGEDGEGEGELGEVELDEVGGGEGHEIRGGGVKRTLGPPLLLLLLPG